MGTHSARRRDQTKGKEHEELADGTVSRRVRPQAQAVGHWRVELMSMPTTGDHSVHMDAMWYTVTLKF